MHIVGQGDKVFTSFTIKTKTQVQIDRCFNLTSMSLIGKKLSV